MVQWVLRQITKPHCYSYYILRLKIHSMYSICIQLLRNCASIREVECSCVLCFMFAVTIFKILYTNIVTVVNMYFFK